MTAITRNVASKCKDHLEALPTVSLDETSEAGLIVTEDEERDVRGVPLSEVVRMIDRLPEGYGQVFRLSVFEGMSHKEIADMLGIEPHSSSSQLARAKKILRKMMQQYWVAVLLLLLVPVTFYLFWEGDTKVKEGKPVVTKQKDTPKESQTELPQKPAIVDLPVHRTTIIAPDNLQSTIALGVDSITVDTLSNFMAQEQIFSDTTATDTTKTIRKVEIPHHDIADLFPEKPTVSTNSEKKWSLELAYAGQFDEQNRYNQPFSYKPYIDPNVQHSPPDVVSAQTRSAIMRIALNNANRPGEDKILRSSHHQMPVTWSLALKYRLNHRFGLESGLSYSRQNSDFEMGTDGNTIREQQTIHYLGIPIKGIYNMYGGNRWGIFYVNGQYEASDMTTIRAPWQFSTTFGLGLQIHLTPSVGFFVEPSLQYYIPMKTDIETYRTEHPFTFSLPLGIRLTW